MQGPQLGRHAQDLDLDLDLVTYCAVKWLTIAQARRRSNCATKGNELRRQLEKASRREYDTAQNVQA